MAPLSNGGRDEPVEYRWRKTALNPHGASIPVYRVPCRTAPMPETSQK